MASDSTFTPSHRPAPTRAADDLLAYAIDRQDIKWCLAHLPSKSSPNLARIDSELQMLKIIAVGWGLTHRLVDSPLKAPFQEAYWKAVQDFSVRFSETTALLIGQRIDYFQTIRDRLNLYLAAVRDLGPSGGDAGRIIGITLARLCDCGEDLPVGMAAARIFNSALARVGEYLTATGSLP
jgi:hypothetical protein